MWKIGNVEIKNRVVLAPMAGVCNSAFRRIVKEMGCGLIYAEMVSDKAKKILNENDDLVKLIAETLLEYETLTKEQIEYLVKTGRMPDDEKDVEEAKVEEKEED